MSLGQERFGGGSCVPRHDIGAERDRQIGASHIAAIMIVAIIVS